MLNGGLIPPGGLDCFNSGFLPASYQGSIFKAGETPVANIAPSEPTADAPARKLALLRKLDQGVAGPARARTTSSKSAIANYELAFRMQTAVPD